MGDVTGDGSGAPSAPRRPPTDAAGCARMFADFARSATPRAPLYARLAAGVAGDEELAGLLLRSPPTQRQPVLLFACVHDLLLAGRGPELAACYPNLTAEPDRGDPLPAFRAFCAANADELHRLLATRSTQTNEIGRCALLVPPLGLLADEVGPLAHLDVGASAGLNLLLDRYRYVYDPGGAVGGPSPVELPCGTRGAVPVPAVLPPVVERLGLDRSPVDIADPARRRWLEACVWPDQGDRFRRLRAALDLAVRGGGDDGGIVRRGDAVADAARLAAAFTAHPVLTTTWVLNYLTGDQRRGFVAALDELGRQRDISWVFAESPVLVPEIPVHDRAETRTVVTVVRWRGGRRSSRHLATAHPHGYWLHWAA